MPTTNAAEKLAMLLAIRTAEESGFKLFALALRDTYKEIFLTPARLADIKKLSK